MLISKKNSLFILFLLVASSTNLDAGISSWLSSIRSFLTSPMTGRPVFKKSALNQRWVGIGALAIGSYAAWKYFKNKKNSKPEDSSANELKAEIERLGSAKAKWTPIEDTHIIYSKRDNNPKQENEDQASITVKDQQPKQKSAPHLSSNEEDDLDKILDEVDSEQLNTITEKSTQDQFNVGDIVQIINDSSSIEMAPDDIKMYNIISNEKTLQSDHYVKGLYQNCIAIVREKSSETIKIEMEVKDAAKISSNFSGYFTISQKDVKKMDIQTDRKLKEKTYVKVILKPEIIKSQFSEIYWSFMDLKNPYSPKFDGQTFYIGEVQKIDFNEKKIAVVKCCFHWRELTPRPTDFEVPINNIFSILDPGTNQPITIK